MKHLQNHDGDVEKTTKATSKQMKLLAGYSNMALHWHVGLNNADFIDTLKLCGLQNNKSFKKDAFHSFPKLYNIDAELEHAQPSGCMGRGNSLELDQNNLVIIGMCYHK